MRTNLDKWNYYLEILNNKTNEFIISQLKDLDVPTTIYYIYPSGKISERNILKTNYSHHRHKGKTYFSGKKPTKKEIEELKSYAESDIPFDKNNIFFDYSEKWRSDNKEYISKSSIMLNTLIEKNNIYYTLQEAEEQQKIIIEENKINNKLKEELEKNFNNIIKDYKFLGWQNSWKYEYYDEDGNLCSETGKPHKSYAYPRENYPEYRNCIDNKHKKIEISKNNRGTENIVICPVCKIYYKYDCSD